VAKKVPKGYFYNARGLLVKKLDEATIKAIKDRFPNKSFDFNKFKYGVPDSDPIHDQLRNMNPERKAVIRERRSKEDYKAKRRLEESDYYERNREKILKNLKEKYRSDKTVGKTGKTLKELIKERNIAALIKKENTQGIFPTGYTTGKNRIGFYKPELALWRDLYRSSQMPGQTRWSLPKKFVDNLPTNELGKKAWGQNNYYKKIKFTDNNTGETIKLDDTIKGKGKTLKEYLNTTIAKETGNKKVFEKATNTYDLKNNLKDVEIKYKGDTQRIGNILRTVASDKTDSNILSVFEVHHPSGVKNNWWDSEVVFKDANRNLNFIDKKLQRDYKTATTATQKNKLLKDAAKEVDKLPGGITYFFDGERVGVKSPTEESVLKAAASTYKDPALTRAINILVNKTKSVRGGCTAVVTAALGGPIDTCEAVIRANPKAAAMKLNNAITATKGPLKDLKETSKNVAKLIDTGQVTTADKLPRPDDAIKRDMFKDANLRYNSELGAFENVKTQTVAPQSEIKQYAVDNPMEVKVGEPAELPKPNKSVLKTVGKTLAAVGAPLPTALLDTYFINEQIKQDKTTSEIVSNPLNWLGLATMSPLSRAAGIDKAGKVNTALRLGLNPGTIRGISRFVGLPGLALSTAMTAYDQYTKYKNQEGFIYKMFNKEES